MYLSEYVNNNDVIYIEDIILDIKKDLHINSRESLFILNSLVSGDSEKYRKYLLKLQRQHIITIKDSDLYESLLEKLKDRTFISKKRFNIMNDTILFFINNLTKTTGNILIYKSQWLVFVSFFNNMYGLNLSVSDETSAMESLNTILDMTVGIYPEVVQVLTFLNENSLFVIDEDDFCFSIPHSKRNILLSTKKYI